VAIYVETSTVVLGCFSLFNIFMVTVKWFVACKNGSYSRSQHYRTVKVELERTSETDTCLTTKLHVDCVTSHKTCLRQYT